MLPGVQESVREYTLTFPREFPLGSWSLNLWSAIAGVKTPCIEKFFISMKKY
jgi:hypothetical protein